MTEDDIQALPLSERAKHYRQLSKAAVRAAVDAPPGPERDNHVALAVSWAKMASDCDMAIGQMSRGEAIAETPEAVGKSPTELPIAAIKNDPEVPQSD